MRSVYLDNNATTPIAPEVRDAMLPFLDEYFGDPAGQNVWGRVAHEAVESARRNVAKLLYVNPDEIVFTSGGTEANNLALCGIMLRAGRSTTGHLIVSALDHASVINSGRFLESLGYDLTVVPCDTMGVVDPESIERAIRPDTCLVSVTHASAELGTIQPINDISRICRNKEVLLHIDAVQTAGKVLIHAGILGVDLLSLSAHKLHGPKGVGALFVREGTAIEPCLHGTGNERGLRSGTENVPGIVGLGAACALAEQSIEETADRLSLFRDRLMYRLIEGFDSKGLSAEGIVHGATADRLPNTLSIRFPGTPITKLLARIPELAVSPGPNHAPALSAIGLNPQLIGETLRLSVGRQNTEDEIEQAANTLLEAWESLLT
ncbi:MAG: cysteine desulfurase family protein [Planctomycetia bacterium]|jgi:cysteine desulfurase